MRVSLYFLHADENNEFCPDVNSLNLISSQFILPCVGIGEVDYSIFFSFKGFVFRKTVTITDNVKKGSASALMAGRVLHVMKVGLDV